MEPFFDDLTNYKEYVKDQFESSKNKKKNQTNKNNKKIKKIEIQINKLVINKENLEKEMADPSNLDKFEILSDLSLKYEQINAEIKELEKEWIDENG